MRTDAVLAPVSWQRMIAAVEKVRNRLLRAVKALEQANVPYAIAGGNAVAAWVSRVDEAAVRNTRDVDILCVAPTSRRPRKRSNLRALFIPGRPAWARRAAWTCFSMAPEPAPATRCT